MAKIAQASFLALLLAATTALAAAALGDFDSNMRMGGSAFNAGAYHMAQESFEDACRFRPADQKAHYCLGMTYWHLYDYSSASEHLQLAFQLDPFSPLGQAAKQDLLEVARLLSRSQRPTVDTQKTTRQTIGIMQRQTRRWQAQLQMVGQANARWSYQLGNLTAQRLQEQADGYRIPFSGRFATATVRSYTPVREVSDLNRISANYVRAEAARRALDAQRDAAQRQTIVQEYMNSSLALLGERPQIGEPHLRAFGTNLYVHYYGNDGPDSPPAVAPADPPLKAVTQPFRPALLDRGAL